MAHFYEAYGNRDYHQILSDWKADELETAFDDGIFVEQPDNNCIVLYANFTELSPLPTRKFKPDEFKLELPVKAALLFYYDNYTVNIKDAEGKWSKETRQVGKVEQILARIIVGKDEQFPGGFINKPVAGKLHLTDHRFVREPMLAATGQQKTELVKRLLDVHFIDSRIADNLPNFSKGKNKKSGNYNSSVTVANESELDKIKAREQQFVSLINQLLKVECSTVHEASEAFGKLGYSNPEDYKLYSWVIGRILS